MRWGFLLLPVLFLSCGQPGPDPSERYARINLFSDPGTLDPRQVDEIVARNVTLMLYEGLTRIGPDGTPQLAMAQSVDISSDKTTYLFHLRDGFWSNGEPVRAQDFVTSWRSVLSPEFPATYAYLLFALKNGQEVKQGVLSPNALGVSAPDNKTLVVHLEHPAPYFLSLVASHPFFPVHPKLIAGHDDPPTNGPFQLDEWRHGSHLTCSKNPDYWDAAGVRLDGVSMPLVENENTSLLMFERDELDYAGPPFYVFPYEAVESLRERGELEDRSIAAIYWYKLNTNHPPLTHPKVRKALSMALNRDQLVRFVTADVHEAADGAVPDTLSTNQSELIAPDQQHRAKALFDDGLVELGITRDELTPLEISFNQGEDHLKIAAAVQQQWETALDIKVDLVLREWHDHLGRLRSGDYQVGRLAWQANYPDPIDFLQPFAHIDGNLNDTGWEDPRFQALLKAATQETDPRIRDHLLHEAEELLVDEMPVLPLFFIHYPYCQNPNLHDVVLTNLATIDFRWAWLAEK